MEKKVELCAVYRNENVYSVDAPYEQCVIVCGDEVPPKLHVRVFTGTHQQCLEYVSKNCIRHWDSKSN